MASICSKRTALVVLRELVELLVHVAVVAELVPRGQDGVDRLRVRLDAPARHEERLPESIPREEVEQARHGHLGVVAQHGRHRHAVRRRVRKIEMHQALGVHVEGERHRAARAARPGNRVLDHVSALPRAILPYWVNLRRHTSLLGRPRRSTSASTPRAAGSLAPRLARNLTQYSAKLTHRPIAAWLDTHVGVWLGDRARPISSRGERHESPGQRPVLPRGAQAHPAPRPARAFEDEAMQERVWGRRWGVHNDVGPIRTVLVHRPGDEIRIMTADRYDPSIEALIDDEAQWYWRGDRAPDLAVMQKEHDALVEALSREGVEVVHVGGSQSDPKAMFTRDNGVIVPGGAIICRMGPVGSRPAWDGAARRPTSAA